MVFWESVNKTGHSVRRAAELAAESFMPEIVASKPCCSPTAIFDGRHKIRFLLTWPPKVGQHDAAGTSVSVSQLRAAAIVSSLEQITLKLRNPDPSPTVRGGRILTDTFS